VPLRWQSQSRFEALVLHVIGDKAAEFVGKGERLFLAAARLLGKFD
jgi:hypothetical protein